MANKWFIGIGRRGDDIFDLTNLGTIEAGEGRYWADPFLAEHEGREWLFFEDYDYNKGRLACMEIKDVYNHGQFMGVVPDLNTFSVVLEEEHHVSFPSVTKIDGEWYMTPERVIAGELLVYRALVFPDVWTVHSRVAMGRYDDPIMRKNGEYLEIWTTDDNKLRVFRSSDMQRWDVVHSEDKPYMRSAGHFIGELRPTQDSVPIYGRAIKFIDPEGKIKHQIEPDWAPNLTGTHTFNVSSKHVVIDGRIRI